MPQLIRVSGACALIAFTLVPAASAQERTLVVPTIAASAAAAADWATTYYALDNFRIHERNPLLRPFAGSPGQLVTVGAAIDAGAVTAWNLTVGRRKPRLAAAGLWALTAFRTYLAVKNLRNTRVAAPR
jgi:hypothetical protein